MKNIFVVVTMTKEELKQIRADIFFKIIAYLNSLAEKDIHKYDCIYDCGIIGVVRVYWGRRVWEYHWFDKLEKLSDIIEYNYN